MNTNKSFRIKSLIGEEATCWPISEFRLSVFWESGVHEFWTPEDLEDMIAHYGWEKLEDSAPQITRIKECSANAYTASLWKISDNFYTLQWDHWVESLTYCKEDVEDNFARGIWTKLEADTYESLPRTFRFRLKNNHPPSDQEIYTYHQHLGGFTSTYRDEPYYVAESHARESVANGNWIVLPSEPEKKLDISTLQLKIEIDGIKEAQEVLDKMVEQSNTTLEAIKAFTSEHPAQVSIFNGHYTIYDCDFDVEYVANSDDELLEILESLLVLLDAAKPKYLKLDLEGLVLVLSHGKVSPTSGRTRQPSSRTCGDI